MKYDFDCVIIGAGIAGMTAAIYLKRSNLNILILDKEEPGGLLNKISVIENYPGFTKIAGVDLATNIYDQVKSLGIEFKYGNVLKIDDHKIVTDIEEISTNKIVIATGRKPRKIKDDIQYLNLSYNAVDEAEKYKDKVVAVIGGGNSALEEALYLSNFCKKVIIMHRNENLRADEIVKKQIKEKKNIDLILDCSITKIKAENDIIYEIETNKDNHKIDALFSFIGYEPSVSFLDGIEMDNNYIKVDEHMQTNINHIYACGDIIKKEVYQLSTAAGEATIAALNVKKSITRENKK
jgi:Thioredoxin reductase